MPGRRAASAPGRGSPPVGDVLDSWKQIAAYLRHDVRTVMRWETTRGLPVRRLPGGARRAVYARKSELEAWRTEAGGPAERALTTPRPSVAVLPFVNLTPDKDNDYFADGLADEILTQGPAAGPSACGVGPAPSAAARGVPPLPEGPALLHSSRRGPDAARDRVLRKAVAIDPDYAAAHLGIADVFAALGLWGMLPPGPAFTRVKAAASRALAIDDSMAAAHVVLGSALLLADWNWELARGHFQRAEGHLAPPTGPFSIGFYYVLAGRSADAFQYFHDVLEKDPLSAIERMQAATVHISRREFDAATTLLEEALKLDDQLPTALVWLGFCRAVQGAGRRVADAQQRRRARHRDGASAPGERPGPGRRG